jgi:hypothetical protein
MASLHEGFGKEQLVESYWGAGQPKAGINSMRNCLRYGNETALLFMFL